jgi:NAD(P)-dependent dehydrogenase (short-subunit alcohol dehydrogenase family)
VVITGAARGIGALTARSLHARGARVGLLGLEPELLAEVATECGDAPWAECDVADREQVISGVEEIVGALGGLDVAIANAGVGGQQVLVGGDPKVWDQTMAVNLGGTFNLVLAAGPHIAHKNGYFLITSSLGAAIHPPLMTAYSASKAAVEALGNGLRIELGPAGAKVGVAYFAELDTDMTARGFATKAASSMPIGGHGHLPVSPVEPAIELIVRGIERRSRRVVYPRWGTAVLIGRMGAQRVVERVIRRRVARTLELAREEEAEAGLTTPQPERDGASQAQSTT